MFLLACVRRAHARLRQQPIGEARDRDPGADDGSFVFPHVAPRSYQLIARRNGQRLTGAPPDGEPVTITAGTLTTLAPIVATPDLQLTGLVRDPADLPVLLLARICHDAEPRTAKQRAGAVPGLPLPSLARSLCPPSGARLYPVPRGRPR